MPERGPISMVMSLMAASIFDLLHAHVVPQPLVAMFTKRSVATKKRKLELSQPVTNQMTPLRPLSLKVRVRMLLEVASGMTFLHCNGVLHLDVKSMNLMLTPSGCVQLNDFGMSRARAELKEKADRCQDAGEEGIGSLPWMAPEMINEDPPTPAADVFSFHVVMYELLTGELPHVDRSPQQIVKFMSRSKRLPLPSPASLEGLAALSKTTQAKLRGSRRAAGLAEVHGKAGSAYVASSAAQHGGGGFGKSAGRVRAEAIPDALRTLYAECGSEDTDQRPCFDEIASNLEAIFNALPDDEDDDDDVEVEEERGKQDVSAREEKNDPALKDDESRVKDSDEIANTIKVLTPADILGQHDVASKQNPVTASLLELGIERKGGTPLPDSSLEHPLSLPPPPPQSSAAHEEEHLLSSVVRSAALEGMASKAQRESDCDGTEQEESDTEKKENEVEEKESLSQRHRRPSLRSGIARTVRFGGEASASSESQRRSAGQSSSLQAAQPQSAEALAAEAERLGVSPRGLALVRAATLVQSTALQLREIRQCFDEHALDEIKQRRSSGEGDSSDEGKDGLGRASVPPLSWRAILDALPSANAKQSTPPRQTSTAEQSSRVRRRRSSFRAYNPPSSGAIAPAASAPYFPSWTTPWSTTAPQTPLSEATTSSQTPHISMKSTSTPPPRHWWSVFFDSEPESLALPCPPPTGSTAPTASPQLPPSSPTHRSSVSRFLPSATRSPKAKVLSGTRPQGCEGLPASSAFSDTALSGVDVEELLVHLDASSPLDELCRLHASTAEEPSFESCLALLLPLLPRTFVIPPGVSALISADSSPRSSSSSSPRPSLVDSNDKDSFHPRVDPEKKSRPSLGGRTLSAPMRLELSVGGGNVDSSSLMSSDTKVQNKTTTLSFAEEGRTASMRDTWDGGWGAFPLPLKEDKTQVNGEPLVHLFQHLSAFANSAERDLRLGDHSSSSSSSEDMNFFRNSGSSSSDSGLGSFANDRAASAMKAAVAQVTAELKAIRGNKNAASESEVPREGSDAGGVTLEPQTRALEQALGLLLADYS
eukprot:CAMPEP_0171924470 /NCGR_PEP_ID=MMETSP0993-20121228/23007_1 /TAXON_ID=483369 /ORGANISM="non described non described, Strain CCMP2098" /LENGTH=1051 /DNA_ID=CAMNT_0012562733 /DNA_START=259 /DNA_END=3414 /DNA_ORIENTATION=+